MKWLDQWLYKKTRDMWDNKHLYEQQIKEREYINMSTMGAVQVDRGRAEGEDRITFELTSAIGGRILNVRRYDNRKDQHDATTYVIPSGEDVGSRVAKIINLELIK
jgi:hypothetical protein